MHEALHRGFWVLQTPCQTPPPLMSREAHFRSVMRSLDPLVGVPSACRDGSFHPSGALLTDQKQFWACPGQDTLV